MTTENKEKAPLPLLVVRIRTLVLALGESADPPWWNTEFMNETGLRFLERLYPRTFFRAAVHSAGKAACEVHDQAVGRVGVYHLFRLPEVLEADIHTIPQAQDDSFFRQFRVVLDQKDHLMEMLNNLSGAENKKKFTPGPQRIGMDTDLMTRKAFYETASVYMDAFGKGKQSFPYFASEKVETT